MADSEKSEGEKTRGAKVAEDIAKSASEATLALNPLVGLRVPDMFKASVTAMGAMAARPDKMMSHWLTFASQMTDVMTGSSEIAPERGDRRFADPAWAKSPINKRLMQSYLAWQKAVSETVDGLDLDKTQSARARLVSSIFTDAVAPSNGLLTNPSALKTLVDTGGTSAAKGLKNFFDDMTKNGGLPSSVDASKFKVGENVANTPGHVVFRNDVLELIHYTANTDKVYERPFIMVPPQINKYYSVDLSPEKSMIQFLLSNGIQPYCISWRNPTAEQRHWTLETYVEALDEAVDAALEITGTDRCNIMGSCSGGITLSAYTAWLAAHDTKKEKPSNKIDGLDPRRLRSRHAGGIRQRFCRARHAGKRDDGQAGLRRHRHAGRAGHGEDVRVDATERPDLELLGQQLPARQRPARFRRAVLERRYDPVARWSAFGFP